MADSIEVIDKEIAENNKPSQPIEREQRYDLVNEARITWESFDDFRRRRIRSRNYYRGKPNETFIDPDTGLETDEDTYIMDQGRIPYKMNQVRPVVMNLKGQFRTNKTQRIAFPRNRDDNEAGDMMSEALRHACDVNRTEEIDADTLEESFLSGEYGWKTGYKWNPELNRPEISIDPIDPMRFFFNTDILDKRMKELRICGEIHDVPLDEIIASFAKTKADAEWISEKYNNVYGRFLNDPITGFSARDYIDFTYPVNVSLARIIEVWKKEYDWRHFIFDRVTGTYEESDLTDDEIDELNRSRAMEAMMMDMPMPPLIEVTTRYEAVWNCYFLTPYGDVLWQGRTPFLHESHPYTIGMASFVDGEIWGLVEDIIDPQRLVNRITTSIDYMFGASSKGVLLVPEDCLPEGMSLQDFASEWTKFNGVIRYKPKQGIPAPQQIVQNSIPAGIFSWLQTMQQMIKDVSGVQNAAQGQDPNSGTAASLYHQQIMQAQTTNRDYFDSFFEARRQRDLKVCKLIAQYYTEPMYLATAGKRIDGSKFIVFDPAKIRDLEFDIVISDTADTPATRQLIEEHLTNLLEQNRLTFRQYLHLSSHPKADMIEKVIDATNPLLADQEISKNGMNQAAGIDPMQQQGMYPNGAQPAPQMQGQMQPQQVTPQQQQMMQIQQAAQNGDRDAMALLSQAQ